MLADAIVTVVIRRLNVYYDPQENHSLCAEVEYGALRIVCKRRVLRAERCCQENSSGYSILRVTH
jgi:hypothetical protein